MATTRGARPVSCSCSRTTGICCPRPRSAQRSRASHCVFSRLWSQLAACACVRHSGHICTQGHYMLPHCTLGHIMSGMGANSRSWGSTKSEEFRGSVATLCFPHWPHYENSDIYVICSHPSPERRESARVHDVGMVSVPLPSAAESANSNAASSTRAVQACPPIVRKGTTLPLWCAHCHNQDAHRGKRGVVT